MAREIEFNNRSGQALYIEIGKKNNLIDLVPEVFDNDFDGHAKMALIDVYGSIYPGGDGSKKPYSYIRHYDVMKNKYRFANILELGDGALSVQKGGLHLDEIASADTPVDGYRKISESPLVYGFGSTEKFVECRYYEDYLTIKEGDFFSAKYEPWPITIYDHQSLYVNSSVIFQPSTISGVLDGKPVLGVGSFDRLFIKQQGGNFDSVALGYVSTYAMGIREDGRKEFVFVSGSFNPDGKTAAIYYIDGELPIVTDRFTLEADWVRLPYVDDGTCIFENAIVRFGGKEFHFNGKWGQKGFTNVPRVEKHGQSQMGAAWYEGKEPYTHRLFTGGFECMEAYDYKLKEWGFQVLS